MKAIIARRMVRRAMASATPRLLAVGLAWLSVAGSSILADAADGSGPNVLLIVVDDLNSDLASFGHPEVHTPNIDRLAARGIRFDRCYCQFALCNPSRESFLSGLRPESSGTLSQTVEVRQARPDVQYLPRFFRDHGYLSWGVGKIFHHNDDASWDRYEKGRTLSVQEKQALKHRSETRERGKNGPEWYPLDCDDAETGDGVTAARAAAMLEEAAAGGKPFFLAVGFRKPHLPWTAPRHYFDLYPASAVSRRPEPEMEGVPAIALQTDLTGTPKPRSRAEAMAAYHACVTFVDAQIGRVLDAMDRLQLWDDTVVVFLSDHGFHLGDHDGLWAKLTDFEAAARVPMMIVPPRSPSPRAGQVSHRIVALVDVYPTLVELCGLPPPAHLDGTSLVPFLNDPDSRGGVAFTDTIHQGTIGRSVRTARWRYTEWDGGAAGVELYDAKADPWNYRNLASQPDRAADVARLKEILAGAATFSGKIPQSAQTPRAYQKHRGK